MAWNVVYGFLALIRWADHQNSLILRTLVLSILRTSTEVLYGIFVSSLEILIIFKNSSFLEYLHATCISFSEDFHVVLFLSSGILSSTFLPSPEVHHFIRFVICTKSLFDIYLDLLAMEFHSQQPGPTALSAKQNDKISICCLFRIYSLYANTKIPINSTKRLFQLQNCYKIPLIGERARPRLHTPKRSKRVYELCASSIRFENSLWIRQAY